MSPEIAYELLELLNDQGILMKGFMSSHPDQS